MTDPSKSFSQDVGIILVDHGSKFAEANALLVKVVALFRNVTGAPIVEAAHMELTAPTLRDAFDACVAQGAKEVVIHPYFLAPGRHGGEDIPRLAAEAGAAHPGVSYRVTAPLGLDKRIIDVAVQRIHEARES